MCWVQTREKFIPRLVVVGSKGGSVSVGTRLCQRFYPNRETDFSLIAWRQKRGWKGCRHARPCQTEKTTDGESTTGHLMEEIPNTDSLR